VELETLTLAVEGGIATVTLSRGAQLNTMTKAFWADIPAAFAAIDADPSVRAVIVASTGKHFTAGLDLGWAGQSLTADHGDAGRSREAFRRHVHMLQETFSVIDRCRVPVIACVQGGCIGGGVDLVTACDLRVGTADCFFTIQEVNIAIVADVGTLQRIPHLLPQGLVRELAYTGRRFGAAEAKPSIGASSTASKPTTPPRSPAPTPSPPRSPPSRRWRSPGSRRCSTTAATRRSRRDSTMSRRGTRACSRATTSARR
jgi:enoyl-CoA hydratase